MFKQKPNSKAKIDTLIGADTRINGDVEFSGGLHLDGQINGNVKCAPTQAAMLSVSEQGCIEGSVMVSSIVLNGLVKGDIEALDRVELGPKARVLGSVQYTTIETAVGAQINGKLIHRTEQASAAADSRSASAETPARAGDTGRKDPA
jgi:cytoskeletal protein CcmA (bactofilin family)